jgi:hypothetical protein
MAEKLSQPEENPYRYPIDTSDASVYSYGSRILGAASDLLCTSIKERRQARGYANPCDYQNYHLVSMSNDHL